MTTDASDRTLGLISIWQVLRKMHWEIELIKSMPERIRIGEKPASVLHVQDANLYATINAASTGLALVDWLYQTVREDEVLRSSTGALLGQVDFTDEKTFLSTVRKISRPINACHQICNANKHFHLRAKDKNFKVMTGEIIFEHPDGTEDLSVITHIVQNGDGTDGRTSVLEMLTSLASWWDDTLTMINIQGRDQFFPRPAP